MKVFQGMIWALVGSAALGLVGCDLVLNDRSERRPVYVREQPQYVEPQPQYVQPQYVEAPPQYVVVQQAPPAIIVERRPVPPTASHIWIDGYWNWDSRRYVWEAGHYAVPPQPGAVWIAARYEADGRGYRYTPGQWNRRNDNNNNGSNNNGNGRGRGRGNN